MKNLILTLSVIITLCGCRRDQINKPDSILLLKVDYQTLQFEGGLEQKVNSTLPDSDTIPLRVNYKPPGDFGSIALYHKPGNKLLFKGTIIWMGKGEISHPVSFKSASSFQTYNTPLAYPGSSAFKPVNVQPGTTVPDLEPVWNAVAKLHIVSEYRQANKKIGVFVYTPSVGIGNPADWDWILVMGK